MVCSAAYTFLVVGLAGQILAEHVREPYQPSLARMSTRDIIDLHRRDIEGYSPTELLCGEGDTCAEACGKGFTKCDSKDHLTHCFNPSKEQTCCPNGSGDSCDNGYFCTADVDNQTWCCPDGLSLKECARKYDIPGPLTSQLPSTTKSKTTAKATVTKETSSEVSHTSTAAKETTITKDASTKESATTSTKDRKPESTENIETSKTSHPHSTAKSKEVEETSVTASSTASSSSITTPAVTAQTVGLDSTPTSTPPAATTSIEQSGSGSYRPANSLMLFIAGALAAIL
ncbi:hypothetical protein RRF57_000769 [Xylaria bambusicola]|uniref:Prp 4 CRoW domain-containing protein n=1 Tax=Xylaria bambusicola TaxID=326684 RepID=A0AAN7UBB0_9PEZI